MAASSSRGATRASGGGHEGDLGAPPGSQNGGRIEGKSSKRKRKTFLQKRSIHA